MLQCVKKDCQKQRAAGKKKTTNFFALLVGHSTNIALLDTIVDILIFPVFYPLLFKHSRLPKNPLTTMVVNTL